MKISIIIPNYNGEKLLQKNLPKVINVLMKHGNHKTIEIILVDDASTDGSIEYIKNQILNIKNKNQRLKIKLIKNKSNLGFSSTANKGVKEAKGEIVVLLNTDVYPEPGFLEEALTNFKDSKVFAIGCLQKCHEGKKIVLRGRGIGRFEKGFLIHRRGEVDKKDTFWVSAGAAVFRKELWEELGGLDTLYNPFYWEDIDLSYRAQKAGFKVLFESKSVVHHQQMESVIKFTYSQEQIKTVAYRNQILFVWLNITDLSFLLGHIFYLPYHIFKAIITFDKAFLIGVCMAIGKLPQVLKSRKRNKKLSMISDREILMIKYQA